MPRLDPLGDAGGVVVLFHPAAGGRADRLGPGRVIEQLLHGRSDRLGVSAWTIGASTP
ncbi:MAG: hypothetical protein K6U88_00270 [Dehalococcoidia bacterium]|nr:hypothetical protein [Dehalococcoidia bacterium]